MNQEEIRFLAWPRNIVDVRPEAPPLTRDICPGSKIVWILSSAYRSRLPEIQALWPGGVVEDHTLETGEALFTSYLAAGKTSP
jgi:hypothetical protein